MLVIPAIDLKNGRCVRLKQGRKDEISTYEGDPVALARRFAAEGAQMLHVVDLDGAFAGDYSTNWRVVAEIIASAGVPVQFGGGVRSIENVQHMIDCGAARVVIGTLAVESPELLAELVQSFGSRICLGIDAREGAVVVRGWEETTRISATDLARRAGKAGVERIIYTDVTRDGMLAGPNIEQTREIARASGLKVTASGGVSSLDDIKCLRETNEPLIDSCIVGKALHEGRFSLDEALRIGSARV